MSSKPVALSDSAPNQAATGVRNAALRLAFGLLAANIWQGVYFAYVTGLTIGYGDLAPKQALTRFLAIAIGFSGVLLTGLVAALAVKAIQAVPRPSSDNA